MGSSLPLMEEQNPIRTRGKKGWAFYVVYSFVLSVLLLLIVGGLLFFYHSHRLPDFAPLKERNLNAFSIVYSEEDEVIGKYLMENRIPISYERIPKQLVNAFIAAEDADFFQHKGVDYKAILRALFKNFLAGRIVQGGSTITQQVTKTFFLTPKRSLTRKLKEVAYAFGLEQNLTKEEILALYLNNIYLGNGAYGVEAAADSYFNKRVEQLNLAEMAMMAGLVKAPSRYSPVNNLKRARDRQAYVLTRMAELAFISQEQREKALRIPLKIQSRESAYFSRAPYFTELIRHQVERKYGKEKLYQEGLRIYTTLDLSLQKNAQRSVEAGLRELDKREGFRGPIQTLSPKEALELPNKKKGSLPPLPQKEIFEGVILSKEDAKKSYTVWVEDRKGILPFSEMSWALTIKRTPTYKPEKVKTAGDLLKPGDVIYVRMKEPPKKDQPLLLTLEQEPLVQGALLCLDPKTGYVRAMVGGRDFSESQFNRAISSRRQPGSAFKPMIYGAALEKGYTPSTILMDSPVEYSDPDGGTYWAPKNYDEEFMGPITFRNALAHSRNVVTVKILEDIGVGYALQFMKRLGIESPIKRDLSIALGTSGVSMMELTSAFAVFANGGERIKPIFIKKIVTMSGEVLEENTPYIEMEEKEEEEEMPKTPSPAPERVISPQNAFIMTHLLQGVVQHGTGQRAKVLGRPVAGKTGTSSDYSDAWFIGYSPSLLAGVWVGFDDKASLGKNETGARAALPIWISFMSQALRNTPIETPKTPPGITLIRVNIETGLPASTDSPETITEAFIDSSVPRENEDRERQEIPSSGAPVPEKSPRGPLPPSGYYD
ncbi:MAG TPA: PBP1A family penicillin-binding protein [Thermodesulfobacteriota bacterium]|nr:PBP1A family penicillin-binding protein [Thermodesulfobacteriota bacterium]